MTIKIIKNIFRNDILFKKTLELNLHTLSDSPSGKERRRIMKHHVFTCKIADSSFKINRAINHRIITE
jgi:hypothetical protein